MKISYVVGVCVTHDAISRGVLDEIEWLKSRSDYDIKLFTYRCDFPTVPHQSVKHPGEIVLDTHFQESKLIVYHFGVHSELFDSILVAPLSARKIIVFHNITPQHLLPEAAAPIISKSFAQLANFRCANAVACVSEVNVGVLREHGFDLNPFVYPLALPISVRAPLRKPSAKGKVLNIAFVGRLVRSKGPVELIVSAKAAAELVPDRTVRLSIIGNEAFSDTDVIHQIRQILDDEVDAAGNFEVELLLSPPDETKCSVLESADIFCLPSYHEGFCVPVIEAMAAGCKIITYDNSNLQYIAGRHAHLVATGDTDALRYEIGKVLLDIAYGTWNKTAQYDEYVVQAQDHVKQFAPEFVRERFLSFVDSVLVD